MKRFLCALLALLCISGAAMPVSAAQTPLQAAAEYVYQAVPSPQTGSIGGDWAVFALARSGAAVPQAYYQKYYAAVVEYVRQRDGVLDTRKYTEYSRLILALTAIGKDPRDVAGYDLLLPLYDHDATVRQGLSGPVWALLALDCSHHPAPDGLRQQYVADILACALPQGGWSLAAFPTAPQDRSVAADADVTAMALCALAVYWEQPAVARAIEAALAQLSRQQRADGGFVSYGTVNAQSTAQVLTALCALDISSQDPRFIKSGNTVESALLACRLQSGGFAYLPGGSIVNQMATEQALYALAALQRQQEGRCGLYRIDDPLDIGSSDVPGAGQGLAGKDAAVQPRPVCKPGQTFTDLTGEACAEAVLALAQRDIVSGRTADTFVPGDCMKRSEFAAIITRALGLPLGGTHPFTDVASGSWYVPYVAAAYRFGIIAGVGGDRFSPDGIITRQEAAAMVARAAKLCGMDTGMNDTALRDMLAQFTDYRQSADWAWEGLAFCYSADLLDQADLEIRPRDAILRSEMAEMVYRLLQRANLLA